MHPSVMHYYGLQAKTLSPRHGEMLNILNLIISNLHLVVIFVFISTNVVTFF